jgi:polyisoprenoid-binding protein YceI
MIQKFAAAAAAAAVALALIAPVIAKPAPPAPKIDAPSGAYKLDKSHATFHFGVDHLGFSNYRMAFTEWDVALNLDVANPQNSSVTATIDANSLQLQGAPKGFREELPGPNWLNAGKNPAIGFKSAKIVRNGLTNAFVKGDLTLNGVTKPVTLKVRFNGAYSGHPMDPNARIGFSGEGVFKRSDFGIAAGIPKPGSKMGVGDDVNFSFEAELSGPPMKQ